MSRIAALCCLASAFPLAHAAEPPGLDLGANTRLSLTGNAMYDAHRFDAADTRLEDASGLRRVEFGFVARRKDFFDAGAQYEFESRSWLDIYGRVHSKGLLGRELGSVRAGWIKTPVGLDGLTASRAPAFLEPALPSQALYAGRRTGVEWALGQPQYHLAVAYYGGNDPEGNTDGTTVGARAVWTPRRVAGDVWHLGISHSSEDPHSNSVRLRARPETGLTDVRLVDTGTVRDVDTIGRSGLEFIRVSGPLTMQAEYLHANVDRTSSADGTVAHGGSAWIGWTLTGESRPYNGTLGNLVPAHRRGALELLARYSRLDLDNTVRGGTQHAATLGANYYWTEHAKFQLNIVRSTASRENTQQAVNAVLLRAQMYF